MQFFFVPCIDLSNSDNHLLFTLKVARLLGLQEAALQPKRAIQVHILTRYSGFGQQKYPAINKTLEETMAIVCVTKMHRN